MKLLEKNFDNVILELSKKDYEKIINSGILDTENFENYEFVFEKPVKASTLLNNF